MGNVIRLKFRAIEDQTDYLVLTSFTKVQTYLTLSTWMTKFRMTVQEYHASTIR